MKKLELSISEYNMLLMKQQEHSFPIKTKVINNIFVALIPIGVALTLGYIK